MKGTSRELLEGIKEYVDEGVNVACGILSGLYGFSVACIGVAYSNTTQITVSAETTEKISD